MSLFEFQKVPPVLSQDQFNAERQEIADRLNGLTLDGVRAYPYSYLIRKNGSVYEAINSAASVIFGGSEGAGDASGDDPEAVIQSAIDDLYGAEDGDGGSIYFYPGAYGTAVSPIEIVAKANVNLIGGNRRTTRIYGHLTFEEATMPSIVWPSTISNLYFDAKSATEDYGIIIPVPIQGVLFHQLRVQGATADWHVTASDAFSNYFVDIVSAYEGVTGWLIEGYLDQCYFERIWMVYQTNGFIMSGANAKMMHCIFVKMDVGTLTGRQLELTYAARNSFYSCRFGDVPSATDGISILLYDPDHSNLSWGNRFLGCDFINDYILEVGQGFSYTQFIGGSAFNTFQVDADVTDTVFRDIAPYSSLFEGQKFYSIVDNGTNTIHEGAGAPEPSPPDVIIGSSSGDDAVLYWPLDTGSGTTAVDLSGNGLDGTLVNGTAWTGSGKWGNNSLTFTAASDHYVSRADHNLLDIGTNDFTLSCWVKTASKPTGANIFELMMKRDNGALTNAGYKFGIESTGYIRAFVCDGTATRVVANGSTDVCDNAWHHILILGQRTGSAIIYVDNEYDGSVDISDQQGSLANAQPFYVGGDVTYGYNYFNGVIDEVRVYNTALDGITIRRLYEEGYGTKIGQLWFDTNVNQLNVFGTNHTWETV